MLKLSYRIFVLFLLSLIIIPGNVYSQEQETELYKQLKEIPGLRIIKLENDPNYKESYELHFTQPLDHLNPNQGKKFEHRMFLYHKGFDRPVVMETDGYGISARRRSELATILDANNLFVEHRYFGTSVPDSNEWKYLTLAQAANDYHRVVKCFKNIYSTKWVNTGISKGGQTNLFYRYFFPNDIDVSVPYVAPLNFEQEEPRIHSFLNSVGPEECRTKILEFQRAVLKNRDAILPMLKEHADTMNYTFKMGLEKTLEYGVFEYSFAFWQWGYASCANIPEATATPEELFKHLYRTSSFSYFDNTGLLSPFFYQAYTEMGYYNYDTEPFKDLLVSVKERYASSDVFLPVDSKLCFDPELMINVNKYLQTDASNILYIYGEYDTWSASAVDIAGNNKTVKMVKDKGSHRTRIRHFEGEQKEKIYSTLEKWLDLEIKR